MDTAHRKFLKPGDLLPGDYVHDNRRVVHYIRPFSLLRKVRVYFTDGTHEDCHADSTLSVRRRGPGLARY